MEHQSVLPCTRQKAEQSNLYIIKNIVEQVEEDEIGLEKLVHFDVDHLNF